MSVETNLVPGITWVSLESRSAEADLELESAEVGLVLGSLEVGLEPGSTGAKLVPGRTLAGLVPGMPGTVVKSNTHFIFFPPRRALE